MAPGKRTRILVADDHTIVRQGLRAILEGEPDMEVVGEAADGREAVKKAVCLAPDVVIMDVSMPKMNGLEATARIVKDNPSIRVVALTMHSSEEYVYSLLKAGAKGYLLKESVSSDLVEAIHAVEGGGTYLHPSISNRVVEGYLKGPQAGTHAGMVDVLTPREREILQLIAEGHTNKEIAGLLGLSVKTIENHRTRIMDKLEIHNVAGLTRYAIERGIASASSRPDRLRGDLR
ncbi:MAG TPA: response regulator transcription factor [Candidatus Polarisedimenticolia bacterium]|jgi:DNA-binding NarL/FixJ family response regulator|nr:response regulator transcription factor [Candidatus Polarisedimenticolia bacterium]